MTGYSKDEQFNIYRKVDVKQFEYSDGTEFEEAIYKLFKSNKNNSLNSFSLYQFQKDWPSYYHLNFKRSNILRPFENYLKNKTILELGCGLGVLTRYLGEIGSEVTAVEGSLQRAKITGERVRDLNNVNVYCELIQNFEYDKKFDVVTLIGVLEYSNKYLKSSTPEIDLLRIARDFLKPNGIIILALENKLGLKYFAGVKEDHLGKSWIGIEDNYYDNDVRTFSRKELTSFFKSSGFDYFEQFIPIPDYKFPTSVVFEEGIRWKDPSFGINMLSSSQHREFENPPIFNINSTFASVLKAGLWHELCDSFGFILYKDSNKNKPYRSDSIAVHYGNTPLGQNKFAKKVIFRKRDDTLLVERKSGKTGSDAESIQRLSDEEFVTGEMLGSKFRKVFLTDEWQIKDLLLITDIWINFLKANLVKTNKLPGQFCDAFPFNLIIKEANNKTCKIEYIDQEWKVNDFISIQAVFLRGIFQTFERLGTVSSPKEKKYLNYKVLIEELFLKYFPENLIEIKDFWEEAEELNKDVFGFKLEWDSLGNKKFTVRPLNWEILLQESTKIEKLEIKNKQNEIRLFELESLLKGILSSRSWKYTKLFRYLRKIFK